MPNTEELNLQVLDLQDTPFEVFKKLNENFDTLSASAKQSLIDEWAPKVRNYGIQLALSIQGFYEGLTVSQKTEQKLVKIQALYPKERHSCIIS